MDSSRDNVRSERFGAGPGRAAEHMLAFGIREQLNQPVVERLLIIEPDHMPARSDELTDTTDICRDDGNSHRHCFCYRDWTGLACRRKHEHRGARILLEELLRGNSSQEANCGLEA